MSRSRQVSLSFVLFLALALGTVAPSSAAVPLPWPCVADNTADSGAGSLRDLLGNRFCGSISFDLPQGAVGEILLLSPLVIDRTVVITGLGADDLTLHYDGAPGANGRVFDITGGAVTIRDLTITGGRADGGNGAGLQIDGGGDPTFVTLSGVTVTDNAVRVNAAGDGGVGGGIFVRDATLTLRDSTVSENAAIAPGAFSFSQGGGIYGIYSNIALIGSTISDNEADYGGGIHSTAGTVTLTDSFVTDNVAAAIDGGGIYSSGTLEISGSTISGNRAADDGGGIVQLTGPLTLVGSTVSDNEAGDSGGGINNYLSDATTTLTNSTVANNSAGFFGGGINSSTGSVTLNTTTVANNTAGSLGGGINSGSPLTMNFSTVSGNTSGGDGGGIYSGAMGNTIILNTSTISGNTSGGNGGGIANLFGTLTLTSSTVVSNVAVAKGGGLYAYGVVGFPAATTLSQSIILGNIGGMPTLFMDCTSNDGTFAPLTTAGNNLVGLGTGCPTNATDLAWKQPIGSVFNTTLADNGGPTKTHALVVKSPALDRISGAPCTAQKVDQRGTTRPQGNACDIGAYELVPAP